MRKTMKFLAVVLALLFVATFALAACQHKCQHVCPTCGKCTSDCTDPACADKCPGHEDGGDEDKYPTDGSVYNDFKIGGTVILGSTTKLGGDFRFTGLGQSSASASDLDIQGLTSGYSTMELDRNGSYVWNETAVESHDEEVIDVSDGVQNLKITIKINEGLKMSGGTEVTAANYLAYILAFSSPVGTAGLQYNRAGQSFVGYDAFAAYDGTNEGVEGATKVFSGLRLIDEYTFSIEIAGPDYYPYYYADSSGAVSPYDLGLVLGEGVEVKDDGQGAYLTDAWYAKTGETYDKAAHLKSAKFDIDTYEYTGPYTISNWNETSAEATLKINTNFAGNFEGQKPHIETIVYRLALTETQFGQLQNGELDVLAGLSGGDDVRQALSIVSKGGFKETHYDRAGYGKLQFNCDFSPTMFTEVRQAIAYSLDREEFANTFTGGYGSVTHGPYSVNFDAYLDNEDALEANLNTYAVSSIKARQALEEGGWIYNSDGSTPYDASKGNGIRYKKLAANEYGPDNVNQTYKAVSVIDGKEYKTEQIGGEYYMPLAVNWLSSEDNPVSDLLTTMLLEGTALKEIGMLLTKTTVDFVKLQGELGRIPSYGYDGTPVYGMYNLATGWTSARYDSSYNWIGNDNPEMYEAYFSYSSNYLSDPLDATFSWWNTENQGLSFDEAAAKAGGADKLGMNYLSFAMVYSVEPGDVEEYNKWFYQYMIRWNELLPDIPLYSNIYYDVYNADILNFKTSPFFGPADAILYCGSASAQG